MKMLIASFVVACTLTTAPSFAVDPVVWDNGDYYADENGGYWAIIGLVVWGSGFQNTLADDFMVEQHSLITRVQWAGWTGSSPPDAFIIEFYASNPAGTLPTDGVLDPSETALASYMIPGDDVEITFDGEWPEPDLDLAVDLPTPFAVTAGELYWMSIQAYYELGGSFGWALSELQQLNQVAVADKGAWETFDFEKAQYVGDMAFKLHGVPACPGDVVASGSFNPPGDGAVDGADLAYLLGQWGRNPGSFADLVTSSTFLPPPDGIVDGADLAVLLGAWGDCG